MGYRPDNPAGDALGQALGEALPQCCQDWGRFGGTPAGRGAPRIATANRVVPLSAQMIGLRFTAAAEAAGIERRVTAHSGMEGARERGCTGNTSLVIADYRLRPDPSIERHPRHPLNSQDERCCP